MIVNPTGGKMRTRSKTRRKSARKNPVSKSAYPARVRRRRASNPKRRMTRRHNPGLNLGLLSEGVTLAAGGGLTQFVTNMVPAIGGMSPLADAGRTAAVAYILGMVANRVGLSRFSRQITLGGLAVTGAKLINSFLVPSISSVFGPRMVQEAPAPAGMQGIGMYRPGMNPYSAYSGLNGIGVQMPGMFPYSDYAPDPNS
jgi:hypothetical protein